MSGYIRYETILFFQSLGLGVLLVIAYDLLCAFRKVVNHPIAVSAAEDFLYWIGTGIVIFICVYRENQGIIRSFLLLGILFGAWICHLSVSPLIYRICTKVLEIPVFFVKKTIKRLLFLGGRGKILMYKIVIFAFQAKGGRNIQTKRSKQVEKGKKKK